MKLYHAGHEWLIESRILKGEISELGKRVGDLLGEVFRGLYNAPVNYEKVEWHDPRCITVNIDRTLSTVDFNDLTLLVFLAHDFSLRVEISSRTFKHMQLMFHKRPRGNSNMNCHPTLEEALERYRARYPKDGEFNEPWKGRE